MHKEWTEEERRAIEAKYMDAFSAADLQEYTEELDGVPLGEVIAELKRRQREMSERKQ